MNTIKRRLASIRSKRQKPNLLARRRLGNIVGARNGDGASLFGKGFGRHQLAVFNELLTMSRDALIAKHLDKEGRDLNKICGYPENPTIRDFMAMYDREGLGKCVNDLYPDECWKGFPNVYQTKNQKVETGFEKAVNAWVKRLNIWTELHRLDKIAGLGEYGILLLGYNDKGALDKPVRGINDQGIRTGTPNWKMIFVQPFAQIHARVVSLDTNRNSPRYQLPLMYEMQFADTAPSSGFEYVQSSTSATQVRVHWTRVLHFADNRMTSRWKGIPRLRPNYNRLMDIRKTLGGSAEMFWAAAFPGYSVETLPDLVDGAEMDEDSVKEQFARYLNGMQRYLAMTGVHVNSLAPQIANPKEHMEEQYRALAATIRAPMRILLGSESGHLASDQDRINWNERISGRRTRILEPEMINPLVERQILVGEFPQPDQWFTEWPDLASLAAKDQADIALKIAQALLQYVTSGSETVIPPLEFMVEVLKMPYETAYAIQQAAAKNKKKTAPLWDPKLQAAAKGPGGPTIKKTVQKAGSRTSTQRRPAARNAL
jgi:uncharacterized protein